MDGRRKHGAMRPGHAVCGGPRRGTDVAMAGASDRSALDEYTGEEIERLRRAGATVFGPTPTSMTGGPAVAGSMHPGPGMHVQIAMGSRLVDGHGATGAEAMRDALGKLAGFDPEAKSG
jgi:hypothetical protein